jgi:quercetin dioxygenase-like cupin family protein
VFIVKKKEMTILKRSYKLLLLFAFVVISASAITVFLPSAVYEWKDLKVNKVKDGEVRQYIKSETKTLPFLDVYATTLNKGKKFKAGSVSVDQEEFMILKEGKVRLNQGGQVILLNAGSVILFPPGIKRDFESVGDDKVCYYTFRWKSTANPKPDPKFNSDQPIIYDWDKIEFKKTDKGGTRAILKMPTRSLSELEMHATTLNEGMTSHAEHQHPDEEIILVRFGTVNESIKEKPNVLGPGSLIFLAPNDMHGIQNAGKGQCEYYAIRWITEKTESVKPKATQN